jgi:preprotein translocase subunit SecA
MALNLTDVVLRPFNYCIIDEVDSILIDEAQTPLIISNNIQTPIEKYIVAAEITDYLELNIHYKVDEKNKNVVLTEEGSKQIEKILSIQDLYDPEDPWIPYIINALKANALFFNNVHYIVQNNRILLLMNLQVELCLIVDGVMDYIKLLKQKKNYQFVKKQKQ